MLSYDQFLELVKSRRSVRTFTDERVSEAVLQKIFQAGNLAPTSCNQQAYRFVVVNDPELIGAFAKISSPKVLRSPQFMLCLTHRKVTRGNDDNIQSTAAVIMTMIYAIESLSLNGWWIAGFKNNRAVTRFLARQINIGPEYALQALVVFGHGAENQEYSAKVRQDPARAFHINRAPDVEDADTDYLDKIMPVYFERYRTNYEPSLTAEIDKHLDRAKRTLHVNCFYGAYLSEQAGMQTTVTNLTLAANKFIRHCHPEVEAVTTRPEQLGFGPHAFPQITLFETLNHFAPDQSLAEAARVLEPGGLLLIVLKNRWTVRHLLYLINRWLRRPHYRQPIEYVRNPCTHRAPARVVKAVERAGLEVRTIRRVRSDRPILSQLIERLLPSYTVLVASRGCPPPLSK